LTATLFVIANIGLALQQYSIGHAIDTLKHSQPEYLISIHINKSFKPLVLVYLAGKYCTATGCNSVFGQPECFDYWAAITQYFKRESLAKYSI
jgi:hypothetical protein